MLLHHLKSDATSDVERIVKAVLCFNLVDLVLTLLVIKIGLATEANPLMDALLKIGTFPFALFKLAIVSAGGWVLWSYRHKKLAQFGAGGVLAAYLVLMFWHLKSVDALVAAL